MKNFSFGVFNYKTKLFKQNDQYIIATKKMIVWYVKRIALWDKKSIVYKENDKNQNF